MKRLVLFLIILSFTSCIEGQFELTPAVNKYIEQLVGMYYRFGIGGGEPTVTDNFTITPLGRLIIVKYNSAEDNDKYDKLQKFLQRWYESDSRVRKVYINQGGTVVVDCRN